MGIHFSEIGPIGQLDRKQTQDLVKDIVNAGRESVGVLSPELIAAVLQKHDNTLTLESLTFAGWFDEPSSALKRGVPEGFYCLSNKACAMTAALNAPRMSFEEACDKIKLVTKRLNSAPHEIDGIRINSLFLFGSTLRDKNARDTVGDLDMAADFTFDARYDGLPRDERNRKAIAAWIPVISEGDERFQVGEAKGVAQDGRDIPDRPFVLLRLWQNSKPGPSTLSSEENERLQALQKRTEAEQERARIIARMIQPKSSIVVKPKQQKPTR